VLATERVELEQPTVRSGTHWPSLYQEFQLFSGCSVSNRA